MEEESPKARAAKGTIHQWRRKQSLRRRIDIGSKSVLSLSRYMSVRKSVNFVVSQSHNHNKMGIIMSQFLN